MAIIGGAGNPVGGSFTGPAEALEIVGDHAYAYSGRIQINTSNVLHLSFTSGNYLFVGEMTAVGSVDTSDPQVGDISACIIGFNGVDLFALKLDTEVEDMPSTQTVPLIIPAYTEVVVNIITDAATAGRETSVLLSGRIYRPRD